MTKTIEDIPNEILKLILVQLREKHGLNPLVKALLVSRLWNETGTNVLYEHVVLNNGNISSFLDSKLKSVEKPWDLSAKWHGLWCLTHTNCERQNSVSFEDARSMFIACPSPPVEEGASRSDGTYLRNRQKTWQNVRSITLNIKPQGSGNLRNERMTREWGRKLTPVDVQLMRLASLLPTQFHRLETFSLYVEEVHFSDQLDMERRGAGFLDARVVQELIKALPLSCTSLELDTNGREIHFGPTSPRICLLIRDMMPRLQHLSLRVAYVCQTIMMMPSRAKEPRFVRAPNLLSLTISFVPRDIPFWFDLMYPRNVCARPHMDSKTDTELPNDSQLGLHQEVGVTGLTQALLKAREQGCLPRAKKLQVFAPKLIHRQAMVWSERETDEVIVERDCATDVTRAFQILPSNHLYRHDKERAIIVHHGVLAMMDHERLKLHIEDGMWQTTAGYKARLPAVISDVQFLRCPLRIKSAKQLDRLVRESEGEARSKWQCLQQDLMEDERHSGRVFEFAGASFDFKDFMPENL